MTNVFPTPNFSAQFPASYKKRLMETAKKRCLLEAFFAKKSLSTNMELETHLLNKLWCSEMNTSCLEAT